MPEAAEIVLARTADAATIAGLSRSLIEHGLPWTWTPWRVAEAIRQRDTEVIVARAGGRIVGFAVLRLLDEEAHLLLLGVVASRRRQGVGRALISWLLPLVDAAGLSRIVLEVRAKAHEARAFYKTIGFVETRVLKRYYYGFEDAVEMRKALGAQR